MIIYANKHALQILLLMKSCIYATILMAFLSNVQETVFNQLAHAQMDTLILNNLIVSNVIPYAKLVLARHNAHLAVMIKYWMQTNSVSASKGASLIQL